MNARATNTLGLRTLARRVARGALDRLLGGAPGASAASRRGPDRARRGRKLAGAVPRGQPGVPRADAGGRRPERVPPRWDADGQLSVRARVVAVRDLTPNIRALTLAGDGASLPRWEAGAHVRLPVRLPDGSLATRAYSLTNLPPASGDTGAVVYELAVKREDDGRGGSAYLHEAVAAGDALRVGAPSNAFGLSPRAEHHVLIAGGIGITPILAMTRALARGGASFEVHYAGRDRAHMAFVEAARRVAAERIHLYMGAGEEARRMDIRAVLGPAAQGRHVYVCGPVGLMDAVRDQARSSGWSPDHVHVERFGGAGVTRESSGPDRPFRVTLARRGEVVEVGARQTLLTALREIGVDVPSSCEEGICGVCAVGVLDGEPDHRDEVLCEHERRSSLCACISRARGDALTLDL